LANYNPENVEPLLIGNVMYVKDGKVTGIYVKAYNKPKVLAGISKVLGDLNINILNIVFPARVDIGDIASIFIVADLIGSNVKPDVLKDELKKLPDVVDVRIVSPQYPQLLFDPYHFPLVDYMGGRFILVSEPSMEGVVVRLREKFGTTGLTFLYYEGEAVGDEIARRYINLGVKSLKNAIQLLLLESQASGSYVGELVKFSHDEIVIRLHNLWECWIARKNGIKEKSSHFERGVIAGLVKAYTKLNVRVYETKCIAVGHPYCEFLVTISI